MAAKILRPVSPPSPPPASREERSYQMVKSELAEVIERIKSATANLPNIGRKERKIDNEMIDYWKVCASHLQWELQVKWGDRWRNETKS